MDVVLLAKWRRMCKLLMATRRTVSWKTLNIVVEAVGSDAFLRMEACVEMGIKTLALELIKPLI